MVLIYSCLIGSNLRWDKEIVRGVRNKVNSNLLTLMSTPTRRVTVMTEPYFFEINVFNLNVSIYKAVIMVRLLSAVKINPIHIFTLISLKYKSIMEKGGPQMDQMNTDSSTQQIRLIHAGGPLDKIIVRDLFWWLGTKISFLANSVTMEERAAYMCLALEGSEISDCPIIVIISRDFLKLIGQTTRKATILECITNYRNQKCIHIWARGIDSQEIRGCSSTLVGNRQAFRVIKYEVLKMKSDLEAGRVLLEGFLQREGNDPYERNYIATESRPENTRSSGTTSAGNAEGTSQATTTAPFQGVTMSSPRNKVTERPHKRADHLGRVVPDKTKLEYIPYYHYIALSDKLDHDVTGRPNYRELAALFGFNQTDVGHFANARRRGQRPTEQLCRALNMRYPDLTVMALRDMLKILGRSDAVNYINQEILGIAVEGICSEN
jgi:hypothetical protein